MGISSTLIGLLPTYAMTVANPDHINCIEICPCLAIGGQWGGAMLLVTESAPANQIGYCGALHKLVHQLV